MIDFDGLSAPLPQALAGALRRLAQLAHSVAWDQWAAQRLTPTQRRILEFLGSRHENLTLSAVARELGVTPATASDSVAALEAKGLIRKRRSLVDGRALALMLTTEGRRSVTELAALPDPLQAAFGSLSASEQETLYRSAMKMLHDLQESGALPPSRMCVRCKYFEPFRHAQSATPHHCSLVGAPLADRHLRIDCPEHEFRDAALQQAAWERFSSGPGRSPGEVQQAPRLQQMRTIDHLSLEVEDARSR
jgi:DNA-binding MarR family transcriptional regulator